MIESIYEMRRKKRQSKVMEFESPRIEKKEDGEKSLLEERREVSSRRRREVSSRRRREDKSPFFFMTEIQVSDPSIHSSFQHNTDCINTTKLVRRRTMTVTCFVIPKLSRQPFNFPLSFSSQLFCIERKIFLVWGSNNDGITFFQNVLESVPSASVKPTKSRKSRQSMKEVKEEVNVGSNKDRRQRERERVDRVRERERE